MTQTLSHKLFKKIDGRELELDMVITSGNISAALVYTQPQELPLVLATKTKEIPFTHNPTPQEMRQKTLVVLDSVLKEFVNEVTHMYELQDLYDAHQVIHNIQIALAPLWVTTTDKSITREFEAPTQITQELLNEMMGEEEGSIERSVMRVKANGYEITPEDVIGIETSRIEIEYLESILDEGYREEISEYVTRHFARDSFEEITYIPFVSVCISALQVLFGELDEFTLLHFDAEDTTVLIKQETHPLSVHQKTYGRAELKRQIIKEKLAPDYIHARDIIRSFYRGGLEDALHAQVEYALGIEAQVVKSILTEDIEVLPKPAFVISSGLLARFVTQEVLGDLDQDLPARHITHQEYQEHIAVVGEFVIPSVEISSLVIYSDIKKQK